MNKISKRYDQVVKGDTIIHEGRFHVVTSVGMTKLGFQLGWDTGWCAARPGSHIQYVPKEDSNE